MVHGKQPGLPLLARSRPAHLMVVGEVQEYEHGWHHVVPQELQMRHAIAVLVEAIEPVSIGGGADRRFRGSEGVAR